MASARSFTVDFRTKFHSKRLLHGEQSVHTLARDPAGLEQFQGLGCIGRRVDQLASGSLDVRKVVAQGRQRFAQRVASPSWWRVCLQHLHKLLAAVATAAVVREVREEGCTLASPKPSDVPIITRCTNVAEERDQPDLPCVIVGAFAHGMRIRPRKDADNTKADAAALPLAYA